MGKIIGVYLIRATVREADPEGLAEGVDPTPDEAPVLADVEVAVHSALTSIATNSVVHVSAERAD